jgi:cbb3-type cytochrome oxidase subunit 1
VGLLCVVLLVADTINMMLAASLGAKKVSMLVTLVFLMAIALAAVIVFVLNTLVLPSYATDEVSYGRRDGKPTHTPGSAAPLVHEQYNRQHCLEPSLWYSAP